MLSLGLNSLSYNIGGVAPTRAVRAAVNMATPNAAPVYDGKYAEELRATAAAMTMKGKGLLACDESTGTIGTRLEANGMENTEANRQKWRNLLFTTEGIGEYVSGAILFEETLFQNDPDGKPFVDVMKVGARPISTASRPALPRPAWALRPIRTRCYRAGHLAPS